MVAKSNIEKLPEPVKKRLNELIRGGRHSMIEMVNVLQEEFPEQAGLPAKSSVQRYTLGIKTIIAREREISVVAEALVGELGENFDSKSGALLAQAVTTLANRCAFAALEKTDAGQMMEIGDVLDLARAAKTVQEARSLNYKERRAVAEEACRKLLEEQRKSLDELGKSGAISQEALTLVIKAAYDL